MAPPGAAPGYGPAPGWPAQGGAPAPGWPAHGGGAAGLPLAGFWIRFLGWLLDGVLYGLLAAVLIVPGIIAGVAAFDDCVSFEDELFCPPGAPNGGLIALGIALGLAGVVLVAVLYIRALAKTGQTWGARIVGVKVIHEDTGQPLGVGKAIGRTLFASFVSAQVFYLGYLWAAWEDRTRTWQDMIVKSVVVKV
jgi:uncharacterized RDD family membrane protein YckC